MPPIYSLRESIVYVAADADRTECDIFCLSRPSTARHIVLGSPSLSQMNSPDPGNRMVTQYFSHLSTSPRRASPGSVLLFSGGERVREGTLVLLLSDLYLVKGRIPAHALLVTGRRCIIPLLKTGHAL